MLTIILVALVAFTLGIVFACLLAADKGSAD
jgi:hypothetical protein